MSPHRLIEGAAFEPEIVKLLIKAYEAAVKQVGKGQPVHVLETLAKRIVEIASTGECDLQNMIDYAVRGVEPYPNVG